MEDTILKRKYYYNPIVFKKSNVCFSPSHLRRHNLYYWNPSRDKGPSCFLPPLAEPMCSPGGTRMKGHRLSLHPQNSELLLCHIYVSFQGPAPNRGQAHCGHSLTKDREMNECPLTAALERHTAVISCNVLLWLLHDPNSPHNDQDVPFLVWLIGGEGGSGGSNSTSLDAIDTSYIRLPNDALTNSCFRVYND